MRENAAKVIPIAVLRKNRREEIRVDLKQMNSGIWLLSARIWFDAGSGEMRPSGGGFAIKVGQIHEFAEAVQAALSMAREQGLISDESAG